MELTERLIAAEDKAHEVSPNRPPAKRNQPLVHVLKAAALLSRHARQEKSPLQHVKRAKGIEERTDNKLAGEPPTAIIPPTWAERPLNENLDVRIMSKAPTAVNAFLRIMRILLKIKQRDHR